MRLARAAAASGAVSWPAPAASSPSGRANETMSEAEGGWSDLLHETALEASSSENLIGTKILHAWDDKDRQAWFEGRVHGRNLNARVLARAPTSNFSVGYSKSLTYKDIGSMWGLGT